MFPAECGSKFKNNPCTAFEKQKKAMLNKQLSIKFYKKSHLKRPIIDTRSPITTWEITVMPKRHAT